MISLSFLARAAERANRQQKESGGWRPPTLLQSRNNPCFRAAVMALILPSFWPDRTAGPAALLGITGTFARQNRNLNVLPADLRTSTPVQPCFVPPPSSEAAFTKFVLLFFVVGLAELLWRQDRLLETRHFPADAFSRLGDAGLVKVIGGRAATELSWQQALNRKGSPGEKSSGGCGWLWQPGSSRAGVTKEPPVTKKSGKPGRQRDRQHALRAKTTETRSGAA